MRVTIALCFRRSPFSPTPTSPNGLDAARGTDRGFGLGSDESLGGLRDLREELEEGLNP